jgi:hypothetical protein
MNNLLKSLNYYKNKLLVLGLLLVIVALLVGQSGRQTTELVLAVLATVVFIGSYTGHIINNTLKMNHEEAIENLDTDLDN